MNTPLPKLLFVTGMVLLTVLLWAGDRVSGQVIERNRGEMLSMSDNGGDPLAEYRGNILLLLLGMPGCPGTEEATQLLSHYASTKPRGVAILRVDVPPPGGKIEAVEKWEAPFPRMVDGERKVAERLEFFYYPTFYILDRDGTVRYSGGCERESLITMVSEIGMEKPGAPKKMYTHPLPVAGTQAADFTAAALDGQKVNLKKLLGNTATLILFGTTTCPYSATALESLPALMKEFNSPGISFVIINKGSPDELALSFYRKKVAGVPVIIDTDNRISEGMYGVSAVPFFYALDRDGRIVDRRPFTIDSARLALNRALGQKPPEKQEKKPGAG